MPYDINCSGCPYNNQDHLNGTQHYNPVLFPVVLEDNGSAVLLILQAPGIEEWRNGRPVVPTVTQGGTGGARIAASWKRTRVERIGFDIVNAVQCFPGKDSKGDRKPSALAICACSKRLREIVLSKSYTKIIALGDVAYQAAYCVVNALPMEPELIRGPHPNSRIKGVSTNDALDALW